MESAIQNLYKTAENQYENVFLTCHYSLASDRSGKVPFNIWKLNTGAVVDFTCHEGVEIWLIMEKSKKCKPIACPFLSVDLVVLFTGFRCDPLVICVYKKTPF